MKIQCALLVICFLAFGGCKEKTKSDEQSNAMNMELGENEISEEDEWEILFDGTSFDNWKAYLNDEMALHWKIEEGAMVFYPPTDRPKGESYNIVTREDYNSFVLSLEWRVAEGANSGIFWGIIEDSVYGQPYETGPEIQVLDNQRHPDAKNGNTHQAGALYDMVAPTEDVSKPAGEWNSCEITINYKEHMGKVVLNGVEIVSFPLDNPEWDALVSDSKFADWSGFGKYSTGKIGLQDHGDVVAFKNIKIKRL
ncbi:MAG: DUF1080 domain-containing protein [Flavobacteriaceae bacterium]|nr:DUF1080 domain-containing protein [Flavobacteriaceae bacterium]